MSNASTYLEAMFGIWHAGLVAVPIYVRLDQNEFADVLDHSRARRSSMPRAPT